MTTTTLDGVTKKKADEQQAVVELICAAKELGLSLTGPDGLLKQLTKTVLETSLKEEMTEHLGWEARPGRCRGGKHPQRHPTPRPCQQRRPVKWRSMFRVTGPARSSLRSCASGIDA